LNKAGARIPFGIPRDLAVLAVAMFVWGFGEGLFIYFYPPSLQRWSSNPVLIGTVLSMLGVAMALVQVPAGYLSDRFGSLPLIRAASILGVVSAVVMALAQTLPVFLVGLVGYTLTSFISAPINSYITSMRGSWSLQRAVTFIGGSFQMGGILGPILGGWIAQTAGLAMIFRYSAGLFLLSTLIVYLVRRPVAQAQEAQETVAPLLSPLANPRFIGLLVVIFLTIFAISMPQQLTSIYLQQVHHLSIQQIGTTGTIAGMGTAIVMFVLGSLRAPTGMIAGQLLAGLFSLFMWRGQSLGVFYTGYLFLGGYRLYRAMSVAAARPLVKAADVGLAYGLVETGNALGVILAPLAAGLLYNYRPEAVYIAGLLALVVTISLTTLLVPKRGEAVITS
jgi:MFS family permease